MKVIGKIVASEKVTGRQRAEQITAGMRGRGLEVEITDAAATERVADRLAII